MALALVLMVALPLLLGAAPALANVAAGLAIRWLRLYQIGDCVALGGHEGAVEVRGLLVTRLRNARNEQVLVPNALVLARPFLNYSALGGTTAVAIETSVPLSYQAPIHVVEQLLVAAAQRTDGVLVHPAPTVRQAELCADYVRHVLRAYIGGPQRRELVMAAVNRSVLRVLEEAGVSTVGRHPPVLSVREADAGGVGTVHPLLELFQREVRAVEAAAGGPEPAPRGSGHGSHS